MDFDHEKWNWSDNDGDLAECYNGYKEPKAKKTQIKEYSMAIS